MPPRNGGLSVFRTSGLENTEIWELGKAFAAGESGREVLGRADLRAQTAFSIPLVIDADGVPHRRHANIIGWPDADEKRREIALRLAEKAKGIMK